MNAPAVGGGGPRTETVLGAFLLVIGLIVAVGFLFELPYGFGGWALLLIATPIVLVTLALGAVLRSSRTR